MPEQFMHAGHDFGAGGFSQCSRPKFEVFLKLHLQDINILRPFFCDEFKVFLNIPPRIAHNGGPFAAPDYVQVLTQACRFQPFEEPPRSCLLWPD
jgi:hypothetical protein